MRTLIWKFRFAWRLRKLLKLDFRYCWQNAESYLEMLNYDLEENPEDCAEEEFEEWRNGADLNLL